MLQLPRTAGCLVCGPHNPLSFGLHFFVDAEGTVTADFTPAPEHIGFDRVTHGGVVATVLDEAMVWAAIWAGKRGCLAAELAVRYRSPGAVGVPLKVEARVHLFRSRLIQTASRLMMGDRVVAEATAKYIPVPLDEHERILATFIPDAASVEARRALGDPTALAGGGGVG
ncbi:MAG TPA: PaaI family thioesterase [Tepidisphaeraceae bacterium]|jgi:acyl-coenzyme A thioesterase PaaI-like protein